MPYEQEKDIKFSPSTLENIDGAMLSFVENLEISTTTNKSWEEVPVFWVGAERAYQVKKNQDMRDTNSVIILPQIVVGRSSVTKKLDKKGSFYSDVPEVKDKQGGIVTVSRRVNQKKTSAFANNRAINKTAGKLNFKDRANENERVVYEFFSMPIPVYLDMTYEIHLRSEYQTQMNDMITPFLNKSKGLNYFTIERNGYRYECFFEEDYGVENNIVNYSEEERLFKATIPVKTLGYLIGDDKNDNKPTFSRRENAVDIIVRERIVDPDEEI